jgi:hypothetical protein
MLSLYIDFILFSATLFSPIILLRLVLKKSSIVTNYFLYDALVKSIIFWVFFSFFVYNFNLDLSPIRPFGPIFSSIFVGIILIFSIKNFSSLFTKKILTFLVFLFFFLLILSYPFIVDLIDYTLAQKTGPDGSGYLIATNYLLDGGTKNSLLFSLFTESGSSNIDYIFTPGNYALPSVESYNLRVASEFLVGSVRPVFSMLITLFTFLSISQDIVSTAINFLLLMFILTALFLYFVINRFLSRPLFSLLFACLLLLNPMILNLHLEGGLPQIISFLCTSVMLYFFTHLKRASLEDFLLFCVFVYSCILIYPDLIFLLIIFIPPFLLLYFGKIVKIIKQMKYSRTDFFLTSASLILVGTTGDPLIKWVSRRFKDASQGGWPQAHWPYIGDLFGITSPFSPGEVGTYSRTILEFSLNLIMFSVFFFSIIVIKQIGSQFSHYKYALICTYFILFSYVYVIYLRDLNGYTNYQALKVLPTFSPFLVLFFFLFIYSFFKVRFFYLLSLIYFVATTLNLLIFFDQFTKSDHLFLHGKVKTQLEAVLQNTNLINTLPFETGGLGFQNISSSRPTYNFKVQNNISNWYRYLMLPDTAYLISQDRCKNPGCVWLTQNTEHILIEDELLILYPNALNSKLPKSTFYGYFVYWFNLSNYNYIPANNNPLFVLKY